MAILRLHKEWKDTFQKSTGDTVTDNKALEVNELGKDYATYYRARQAWLNWEDFRAKRRRVKRYLFGDQWGDLVRVDGKVMTERMALERQGIHPVSSKYMFKYYNKLKSFYAEGLIDPIVFAVEEDADDKSNVLTYTLLNNIYNDGIHDVLPQQFGEMCISGMSIVCEEWGRINTQLEDTHTIEVNPDYVGIEYGGHDVQMRDISLLVEIRDYKPEDLAVELANEGANPTAMYDAIRQIYAYNMTCKFDNDATPSQEISDSITFEITRKGLCRTYRVWTREKRMCYHVVDILNEQQPLYKVRTDDADQLRMIEEENNRRLAEAAQGGIDVNDVSLIEVDTAEPFWDDYWYLRILAPDATVLLEKENPYEHGLLPYTICVYEFCDGIITPFFSYILEQQRLYNRVLTQKDTMTERALKDLKMIPTDSVPQGMNPREFAESMSVVGNTIFFKPSRTGTIPQIISSNSHDVGLDDLLSIYRNDMEEVTNENAAFLGKEAKAGTPTSRYALESENSGGTFAFMFKRFMNFERGIYYKKVCNIQQFYTTERDLIPSQNEGIRSVVKYDPKSVGDIKFDFKISRGLNAPVARMAEDTLADQFLAAGIITPEQRVELGYILNKEKFQRILQSNKQKQQ